MKKAYMIVFISSLFIMSANAGLICPDGYKESVGYEKTRGECVSTSKQTWSIDIEDKVSYSCKEGETDKGSLCLSTQTVYEDLNGKSLNMPLYRYKTVEVDNSSQMTEVLNNSEKVLFKEKNFKNIDTDLFFMQELEEDLNLRKK